MSRPRPSTLDESPLSEFITKMRDAHRRRLAAVEVRDKRAIELEMTELMRQYLGRSAWDAAVATEQAASRAVPRGTRSPRRARPGPPSKFAGDSFDHKLAQAGDRMEDD